MHLAAGCPGAVGIVAAALFLMNPGIKQNVARATVETTDWLVLFDQAEVAETADVEYRQALSLMLEQCLMKGWNQRCTLATCGHITAPKIPHHADAAELGEQSRIADLHGEAACRLMADGLAMAANGANIGRLEILGG
ncbi:hypothetical protein D3C79_922630 [compost metagenome]